MPILLAALKICPLNCHLGIVLNLWTFFKECKFYDSLPRVITIRGADQVTATGDKELMLMMICTSDVKF